MPHIESKENTEICGNFTQGCYRHFTISVQISCYHRRGNAHQLGYVLLFMLRSFIAFSRYVYLIVTKQNRLHLCRRFSSSYSVLKPVPQLHRISVSYSRFIHFYCNHIRMLRYPIKNEISLCVSNRTKRPYILFVEILYFCF